LIQLASIGRSTMRPHSALCILNRIQDIPEKKAVSMTIAALLDDYRSGRRTPSQVIADLLARRDQGPYANVWIHRVDSDALRRRAHELESGGGRERLPLYGVPFAAKDNIDVAGLPTTAACPAFSYVPQRSATVIEKLERPAPS
jgi:allophanate hydrolase